MEELPLTLLAPIVVVRRANLAGAYSHFYIRIGAFESVSLTSFVSIKLVNH